MIDYVIDANVLMSIVISGKASYKNLLNYYNFIIPEFGLVEIDKYQNTLFNKTSMKRNELINYSYSIFSSITILPSYIFDEKIIKESIKLVEKVDIKDLAYIALATQLDLMLLTRDKTLVSGMKKQKFKNILSFDDFLRNV